MFILYVKYVEQRFLTNRMLPVTKRCIQIGERVSILKVRIILTFSEFAKTLEDLIAGDHEAVQRAQELFAKYQQLTEFPKKKDKKYAAYLIVRPTDVASSNSYEFAELIVYAGRSLTNSYRQLVRYSRYNNYSNGTGMVKSLFSFQQFSHFSV
jgi:hypothetical protein